MEIAPYGTEKEYMDCVINLIDASTSFLDNLRNDQIKYPSARRKGRLENTLDLLSSAELKFVKDMEPNAKELDEELTKLIKKFQVIKNSYRADNSLKEFLGDFNRNSTDTYKKLVTFIDASIGQIDRVITAYSKIDKSKKPAKNWILTVLSSYSSDQARGKAIRSKEILKNLESIIEKVREISHNTKLDLLNIRSVASKYTSDSYSQNTENH